MRPHCPGAAQTVPFHPWYPSAESRRMMQMAVRLSGSKAIAATQSKRGVRKKHNAVALGGCLQCSSVKSTIGLRATPQGKRSRKAALEVANSSRCCLGEI